MSKCLAKILGYSHFGFGRSSIRSSFGLALKGEPLSWLGPGARLRSAPVYDGSGLMHS